MDKIDFFLSNDNLAVNHTVCAALFSGKKVQYKECGKWYDYNTQEHAELFGPWCYKSNEYSWRVKPDTLKITYRVALMTDGDNHYTLTSDEFSYSENKVENMSNFIMWLEETVTKEIEIG